MKRGFFAFFNTSYFAAMAKVSSQLAVIVLLALAAASCRSDDSSASGKPGATPDSHAGHAAQGAQASMTPRVPQYRPGTADPRSLPVTLDPAKFSSPYVARSYRVAKEMPEVLAQQPCYCYCDAGFGHKSLLDCHIDEHSAGCDVCLKESLLAERLHNQGKSAEDIRNAIVRGEWKEIELK